MRVTGRAEAEPSRLIELFGAAALDSNAWQPAIRALASATRSSYGQLIMLGGPAVVPAHINDVPPYTDEELLSIDGYSSQVNTRVAAADRAGVMQLVSETDYDAVRPKLRYSDYEDYVRKWDLPYGCQVTLSRNRGMLVGLAVLRQERDGRTDAAAQELLATLAPHILGAVRTRFAIGRQSALLMAQGLEAAEAAAFILDAAGAVSAMTARAEAIAAAADVLTVRNGRLLANGAGDDQDLQMRLGRSLRLEPGELALRQEVLIIGRPERRMLVQIDALPSVDWSLAFAPRVLVVVRSASVRNVSPLILQAAFGLTPSEAAITQDLAAGVSREEIANARGASLGTVRQQVKAILQKVGVSREAELIVRVKNLG